MMTTIGGNNIPLDLMIEIFLRLPAKSVLRFRFVSKSWCSIITSQQFIDAFMSRRRLLLSFHDWYNDQVLFFSIPHQSCLSSSSVLVAEKETLTMSKPKSDYYYTCNSVRGFICCCIAEEFVVCNPTTGQVIHLLDEKEYDYDYDYCMYLGYNPNSDQYKVLRIMSPWYSPKLSNSHVEHSVRTLGGQGSSNSLRPIKTSIRYFRCYQNGVCIDGAVYYKCEIIEQQGKISCFDVGSELLRLIEIPEDEDLPVDKFLESGEITDYLGKLAVYCYIDNGCRLWVLDDVKNQLWSKKTCIFKSLTPSMLLDFRFRGVTSSGEIIYVPFNYVARCDSDPLELFCYDMENKMEKKVKVKVEVEGPSKFGCFTPHLLCSYVENIVYL